MTPARLLMEMLGNLVPARKPIVPHVPPRLVMLPPVRGPKRFLYLKLKNFNNTFALDTVGEQST